MPIAGGFGHGQRPRLIVQGLVELTEALMEFTQIAEDPRQTVAVPDTIEDRQCALPVGFGFIVLPERFRDAPEVVEGIGQRARAIGGFEDGNRLGQTVPRLGVVTAAHVYCAEAY